MFSFALLARPSEPESHTANGTLPVLPLFAALALFCLSSPLAGQVLQFEDGLTYNNFFTATFELNDGSSFRLFDLASFESDNPPWPSQVSGFGDKAASSPSEGMKYFLWVRRAGNSGFITYPLPFQRIKKLEFTGPYGGSNPQERQEGELDINKDKNPVTIILNNSYFTGWFGTAKQHVLSYRGITLTLTDGSKQPAWLKSDGLIGGIDEAFGSYATIWLAQDDIKKITFDHSGNYSRCPENGAIFYTDSLEYCPFDGTKLIPSKKTKP